MRALGDDQLAVLAECERDAREWSDADFRAAYEEWSAGLDSAEGPELAAAPGADEGGGTEDYPF